MTGSVDAVREDDLQAYVDGLLSHDRIAAVEAYLVDHPDQAERLASYRKERDQLRTILRPKVEEPIPSRLRIEAVRPERGRARQGKLTAALTACLGFALGGATGWFAGGMVGSDLPLSSASVRLSALTRDAISAHRTFAAEVTHPVEVRADQESQLARWIARRLGRTIEVPNLSSLGLRLMGGRILPAGQDAAAQLMYEDEHGMRVTLYVRTGEKGSTAFRFARHDEVLTYYWIDDGCGYAVSAATDRDGLLKIAKVVFAQLEESGGSPRPTL